MAIDATCDVEMNCGSSTFGGLETVLYNEVVMTVWNGSSEQLQGGGRASSCSCAVVSEVQINGIPKPCPQEVASAT